MGEQFCISCSKILNKNHGKLIQGTLFEILQVLFDNSNLEFQIGSKVCENCEEKVIVAFRFKGLCIYTYDRLHPYISCCVGNNERVDLKMIYAKELQCEEPNDGYICRLCLELVKESDKNLLIDSLKKKNLEDTFNVYLPEVNLDVIKDPIICKRCLQSLGEFMSFRRFINNILKIAPQKQLNNGDHSKDNQQDSQIKNKSIHINSAKEEKCSEKQEPLYLNTKHNPNCFERISKSGMYRCKICPRKFKNRGNLGNHMRSHSEIWLKCKLCEYKSKREMFFKNHEKMHISDIELKIHKCNKCEFRTKNKNYLRKHEQNLHSFNAKGVPDSFERISKSGMHRCNICLRKFKKRVNLACHMLSHTGIWFKCKLCFYKSKRAISLTNHEKIHNVPEIELKIHKCNKCEYRTKSTSHLRRHEQTLHNFNAKDVPDSFERISKSGLYRCKICLREFKKRANVATHMRAHTDRWFKCKLCSYESRLENCLTNHEKTHDVPEIELKIHKCNKCEYRTKNKQHLRNHEQRLHGFNAKDVPDSVERISKSGMYRCKICHRECKTRANVATHMRSHTNIWFKCKLCSYKSKYEIFLTNHEENSHQSS